MNLHLAEIALHIAPGAHAVLLMDQAGWHLTPKLELPTNIVSGVLPPPFAGGAEGAMFRAWRAWTYDDFRAYA